MSKEIIDRQLETRSKFVFNFNRSDGFGSVMRTLHFAENIEINESVQANYSEYTPLGSNGSVFTFLGSKSRSFDIKFNITLPNIMAHTLIKPPSATKKSKVTKASYFAALTKAITPHIQDTTDIKNNIERFANDYIQNILLDGMDLKKITQPFSSGIRNIAGELFANSITRGITTGPDAKVRSTALLKVMYWINLIRSSVMTSAKKPSLGPPIVRIVHGILYQNVPCIVTDYTISHDEKAGLDEVTMMPRVLKVSMRLREVRLRGADFNPNDPNVSNMMPGWDSFIEEGFATFDPTYFSVGNTKDQGSI